MINRDDIMELDDGPLKEVYFLDNFILPRSISIIVMYSFY